MCNSAGQSGGYFSPGSRLAISLPVVGVTEGAGVDQSDRIQRGKGSFKSFFTAVEGMVVSLDHYIKSGCQGGSGKFIGT